MYEQTLLKHSFHYADTDLNLFFFFTYNDSLDALFVLYRFPSFILILRRQSCDVSLGIFNSNLYWSLIIITFLIDIF